MILERAAILVIGRLQSIFAVYEKNCTKKDLMLYYSYGKTIEPKAALSFLNFNGGYNSPPDERKEGDAMYVTYQDLIQIGILIVALVHLIYQIYKGKKK